MLHTNDGERKKMKKEILIYQIGFWVFYFLDIFTSYINGFEKEMNPIINFICNNFSCFVYWKIGGIFVFLVIFITSKDKLLKYSKWAFICFLVVNILNILNFWVSI